MNWKQISEQYPKAWEKWFGKNKLSFEHKSFGYDYLSSDRDLYDFFDQEGIIVQVDYMMGERNFSYSIYILPKEINFAILGDLSGFNKHWSTRTEAEQQAFTKAFSILEERLSK